VTSEWYIDPQGLSGAYWEDDPYQGVSENTRRRESDETFYCGAPVEGYDNRWDLKADDPDFEDARRRDYQTLFHEKYGDNAEFEPLLSSEHDELKSVIAHFQSISAVCVLWQNGVFTTSFALNTIQKIVKGG